MKDKVREDIHRIINETGFKTINKFKKAVLEKYPDVTDKELREIYNERNKDPRVDSKKMRHLMIKIFSSSTDTWFHDLMDNGKNSNPRYFHIFIGTNNRYGVANPCNDKKQEHIMNSFKTFVDKYKPIKLTSDEDTVLLSEQVLSYLKSKNIRVLTITDQNHSSLGIIDRFIRTLRDMLGAGKVFSKTQMKKFINSYNNSIHSSIGCTPTEMLNDPDLEERYIIEQLKARDKQLERKDFNLDDGDVVKYLLPRTKLDKNVLDIVPRHIL